jgi:hypothetical protein
MQAVKGYTQSKYEYDPELGNKISLHLYQKNVIQKTKRNDLIYNDDIKYSLNPSNLPPDNDIRYTYYKSQQNINQYNMFNSFTPYDNPNNNIPMKIVKPNFYKNIKPLNIIEIGANNIPVNYRGFEIL